ncbi:MAG: lipase family alpha/beta hydrolase [Candidatus Berkiellales bacterium]
MKNNEVVVLLHGIIRTKWSMILIERALKKHGYQVLNIDYPSRKKDIPTLADEIFEKIKTGCDINVTTLHFVTHSMGGIIVRYLLFKYPMNHLGKVVMLSPPNQGSEVADFLQNNWFYQVVFGPAGQQLTTTAAKNYPQTSSSSYPLGIIAGNKWWDPLSHSILPSSHDGKVTVESTKLAGMTDHIVLSATHSFMMYNPKVIHQVVAFLEQGHFDR